MSALWAPSQVRHQGLGFRCACAYQVWEGWLHAAGGQGGGAGCWLERPPLEPEWSGAARAAQCGCSPPSPGSRHSSSLTQFPVCPHSHFESPTGGLLGYLVYDIGLNYITDPELEALFLSASAAAVAVLSCYLSAALSLDASMRLLVITFLLTTFGANGGDKPAAAVAALRTGGIISGVVVIMTLTVLILPKSATVQALRYVPGGFIDCVPGPWCHAWGAIFAPRGGGGGGGVHHDPHSAHPPQECDGAGAEVRAGVLE